MNHMQQAWVKHLASISHSQPMTERDAEILENGFWIGAGTVLLQIVEHGPDAIMKEVQAHVLDSVASGEYKLAGD